MGRVSGKVALITGAAAGLGRADAIALVREGARVCITDVSAAAGEELALELNRMHAASAHFIRQDVREEDQWIAVIEEVKRRFGALHILVNNAGLVVMANPETTTLEQFRLHQSVMSEGVFLGCKHAIPAMRDAGGGSIINMSSIASHLGYPVYFAYSAAKGAVRSMTKSVAVHCQMNKYNIRCNSIHPGAMHTNMVEGSAKELGIPLSAFEQAPTGLGKPEDVANLVLFLASDESRFVNGAELMIDNALLVQ
jgi:3(or 17)beta-hydroxysteroid dehydrogenase